MWFLLPGLNQRIHIYLSTIVDLTVILDKFKVVQ